MLRFPIVLACASLLLSGCHEGAGDALANSGSPRLDLPPGTPPTVAQDVNAILAKAKALPEASVDVLNGLANDPAAAARFVADSTARSYSFTHGNQIEYLSPDGRTWLWYPGNIALLPGRWKIANMNGRSQMCFAYGSYSYNPATQTAGGNWECEPLRVYLLGHAELVKGDPLKLSTRPMPFVATAEKLTLAQVAAKAGISAPLTSKITW